MNWNNNGFFPFLWQFIVAKIITGYGTGDVFMPRKPIVCTDYELKFKQILFPVRVCFAITISKSQGRTLKMAGADLSTEYVSLVNCMLHFLE